jgi:4-amino-4-deoxy-L-arabinose transferase-like glycosyltransferase
LRQVVGVRMQEMRDSPRLGVHEDKRSEGDEIEQVAPPAAEREGGQQQHEQIAIGCEREPDEKNCEGERESKNRAGQQRVACIQRLSRWAPALAVGAAALLAFAARIPFGRAPLTADEGGYAEVARLWGRGAHLYRGAWVDRPQGLILIFRGLLDAGGGSTESIRLLAAAVAITVVLATMALATRLCGSIEGAVAGLLLATFGASPFIESFTLAGELLASLPAVLSLLAFVAYLRGRQLPLLILAGLLTGCALMIKQSAFDAGLAAILFLLVCERRRGARPAAVLVLSALVPVALGAVTAPHFADWWNAVVAYRGQGDSLVTGSPGHRLQLLLSSLPAAVKAFGLLGLLAAAGWRRSPLLARLWLGAALLGVLGGGNFHAHYYLQLAAPLSLLAAIEVRRLLVRPHRALAAACCAAGAATVAFTAPLWFASGAAQARTIWPHDPHLVHDGELAAYVRTHTEPGQRILVIWAAADIYELADRPPAEPFLWIRNLQALPQARAAVRRALVERKPALVLEVQRPDAVDRSGATSRILRRDYRLLTRVGGTAILRPLSARAGQPRSARLFEEGRRALSPSPDICLTMPFAATRTGRRGCHDRPPSQPVREAHARVVAVLLAAAKKSQRRLSPHPNKRHSRTPRCLA